MCTYCDNPNGRYAEATHKPWDDLHGSDYFTRPFSEDWIRFLDSLIMGLTHGMLVFLIHHLPSFKQKDRIKKVMGDLGNIINTLEPDRHDMSFTLAERTEVAMKAWEVFLQEGLMIDHSGLHDILAIFRVNWLYIAYEVDQWDGEDRSLIAHVNETYTAYHLMKLHQKGSQEEY